MIRTLAAVLVIAACANTATQEMQEIDPPGVGDLLPGEAVVVVSLSSMVEGRVAKCVGQTIREFESGIKVISSAWFRERIFPLFESGATPTTVDELTELMETPAVERRISKWGVRYVVALSGYTESDADSWGDLETLQAGIVLGGFSYWKSTRLNAVILDLKHAHRVGEVSASASGETKAGVLLFVPYFSVPPDTKAISCKEIAQRVIAFLKSRPRPPDGKEGNQNP